MTTFQYHYDPLDRLIQTAGIRRFYNKSRMTTEIEGAVQRSVFQVGDQLLAEGGAGGSNLLATNLQRSVLHTVNPDKTQSIAYSVYGHRSADSGVPSVLGFNGERADPVTGHYLLGNGYRAFNPVLMRFNSPDSFSPFGRGGINGYAYCSAEPVNRTDPSGHQAYSFIRKALNKLARIPSLANKGTNPLTGNVEPLANQFTKFESIDEVLPGIFVATDYTKKGQARLTVNGHGNYDAIGGYVRSGDKKLYAGDLYPVLKEKSLKDHEVIRLLICNSGQGESNVLGQGLATLSGLKVKAYAGIALSRSSLTDIVQAINNVSGRRPSLSDAVLVLRDETVVRRSDYIVENGVKTQVQYTPRTFWPN